MSLDHRNHGADHVELGANIETYACATAVVADEVSAAAVVPSPARADGVSEAWVRVVDAQADLASDVCVE